MNLYGERSHGYIDRTHSKLWGYSGSVLYAPTPSLAFQVSADGSQTTARSTAARRC